MTATMTQINCDGAASPPSLLKLGSPSADTHAHANTTAKEESTAAVAAAAVFKISPETALQHLCANVERLNDFFESNASSLCSTPGGSEAALELDGQESVSVGLHCGNAQDHPTRSKTEALQMAMLSRKFLSKKVPPIALQDYLLRLHRFCPMSTAVYLAASVYITRMTLIEKLFRVTPKNMHRLVLAGLLVATKALEDLSYPHPRIAKVGGVTEQELSKLEISFCFLADFDLKVDALMLMSEVRDTDDTDDLG